MSASVAALSFIPTETVQTHRAPAQGQQARVQAHPTAIWMALFPIHSDQHSP